MNFTISFVNFDLVIVRSISGEMCHYGLLHMLVKLQMFTVTTLVIILCCRYMRMSPESFDNLVSLVSPLISKVSTRLRKLISSAERLALTLRFLTSGNSQQSMSFAYRIGRTTVL